MNKAFWVLVHGFTIFLVVSGLITYFGAPSFLDNRTVKQVTAVKSAVTFPAISGEPNPNKVLEYVNALRLQEGLIPLDSDAVLLDIASRRADDMAENAYYAHKNRQGKIFYDIMEEENTAPIYACENLALESAVDEKKYYESWLMSAKGHKECMLNPNISRAGYSVRKLFDTDDGPYYVVVGIHGTN